MSTLIPYSIDYLTYEMQKLINCFFLIFIIMTIIAITAIASLITYIVFHKRKIKSHNNITMKNIKFIKKETCNVRTQNVEHYHRFIHYTSLLIQ